jgi:cytosine/adenosine deaminase-related metal-dependent hydrolase
MSLNRFSEGAPAMVRARQLLPIQGPPISNGAMLIEGGRIRAVGAWSALKGEATGRVLDLGEQVVLPGLINAHCHLDYTDMAGQIPPRASFSDWIKQIVQAKAAWGFSEYAQSWVNGAQSLLATGTTFVADHEGVPELLPHVWECCPLPGITFLEVMSVRGRRPPAEAVAEAVTHLGRLPASRWGRGLAPHAPYSTTVELLGLAAREARRARWRLSIHAAESAEEDVMFRRRQGAMFYWLAGMGRDMTDCGNGSVIRLLEAAGVLGPESLLVHANYLAPDDPERIARHGSQVVHCPRSHDYFGHQPFPHDALRKAGVNVCLGTDSLATVKTSPKRTPPLSMPAEMATLATKRPELAPDQILRMGTLHGALALGLEHRGRLAPGMQADFIAVPHRGRMADAAEAVIHHPGPVTVSFIRGEQVYPASIAEG